jgi:hypothetical protein
MNRFFHALSSKQQAEIAKAIAACGGSWSIDLTNTNSKVTLSASDFTSRAPLQFFGQGKHSNRHLRQRTGQRFFYGVAWRRGGLRPFGDKPYRHRDQAGPVESSGGGSFRQTSKEYTTCNASCSGRQKI